MTANNVVQAAPQMITQASMQGSGSHARIIKAAVGMLAAQIAKSVPADHEQLQDVIEKALQGYRLDIEEVKKVVNDEKVARFIVDVARVMEEVYREGGRPLRALVDMLKRYNLIPKEFLTYVEVIVSALEG